MNLKFSNLLQTNLPDIHQAFNDAFSAYAIPFQLTESQLQYMLERRGYDARFSYGAFQDELLVGFILNGIGLWNNQRTAYDTGTGIRPAYQGKGIAAELFAYALKDLKEQKIEQYLLEVIKTNTAAFSLYQKKGFDISRHFKFYVFPKSQLDKIYNNKTTNFRYIELPAPDWSAFASFWDFNPSWQNSMASISRKQHQMHLLGAFDGDKLIAYGFIEKHTGDIPQIAVHRDWRRKGIGSTLLLKLSAQSTAENIRFINVQEDCASFKGFADFLGLKDDKGQFEMVLGLGD